MTKVRRLPVEWDGVAEGQYLRRSNNKVVGGTPAGSGTNDHGDLVGLNDDDHTQYVRADGTRAFTGNVGGVTPTQAAHLTRKDYVDNAALTTVRRNSGQDVGSRRRLNLIEGANVTLTVADDAANEEIDVTIAASGGGNFNPAGFSGAGYAAPVAVSQSGGVYAVDLSLSNRFHLDDLTGNRSVTFSGAVAGMAGEIYVAQGAGGPWTLSFPATARRRVGASLAAHTTGTTVYAFTVGPGGVVYLARASDTGWEANS